MSDPGRPNHPLARPRRSAQGRLRAFNVRHSRALGVSQNPSIFDLKSLLQIS
jgi:hypothetical protein